MIKKSVILSFVLLLLVFISYVYAEGEVCCLSLATGGCAYGQSSHTGTETIDTDLCNEIGGEVIQGITSTEQCASQSRCQTGCCCEFESGRKVGKAIPEGICNPLDWKGTQANCQGYCQGVSICGDGECTNPETYENCPQDCQQVIIPPGGAGEEAVPECTVNTDCANKCLGDIKKYNGLCDEGTCKYSSEENCGVNNKICIIDKCVERVDCSACNEPLGLFGMVTACDQGALNLGCYLDYTFTIVDSHQECENVDTCYNYKSAYACNNNKCLQGKCEWMLDTRYNNFDAGVCRPRNIQEQRCDFCDSNLNFNSIFDKCDSIRCSLFGDNICSYNNVYECVGGYVAPHTSPAISDAKIFRDNNDQMGVDLTETTKYADYGTPIKFSITPKFDPRYDIDESYNSLTFTCLSGDCSSFAFLNKASIRKDSNNNNYYIVVEKGDSDCIKNYNCNFPIGEYKVKFEIKDKNGGTGKLSNVIEKKFGVNFKEIQLVKNNFNIPNPKLEIKLLEKPTKCELTYTPYRNGLEVSGFGAVLFTIGNTRGTDGRYNAEYQIDSNYPFNDGKNEVEIKCTYADGSTKSIDDPDPLIITIDSTPPTVTLGITTSSNDYVKDNDVYVLTKNDKTQIKAHVNEIANCNYSKNSANMDNVFDKGYTGTYDYVTPLITFGSTAETYYVKCVDEAGNPSDVKEIKIVFVPGFVAPVRHDSPTISNAQIFDNGNQIGVDTSGTISRYVEYGTPVKFSVAPTFYTGYDIDESYDSLTFTCLSGDCNKFALNKASIRKGGGNYYVTIDQGGSDCIKDYNCNFPTGEYKVKFEIKDKNGGTSKLSNVIEKKFGVNFKEIQLVKNNFNIPNPKLEIKLLEKPTKCELTYTPYRNGLEVSGFGAVLFTIGNTRGTDGRYNGNYQILSDSPFKDGDNPVTIECTYTGESTKSITKTIKIDSTKPEVTLGIPDSYHYEIDGEVYVLTTASNAQIKAHVNEEVSCKYGTTSPDTVFLSGLTDNYDYVTDDITFTAATTTYKVRCFDLAGNPSDVKEIKIRYQPGFVPAVQHNPPALSNLQIKEVTSSGENDIKGLSKSGAEYGSYIKFSIDAQAAQGFNINKVDLKIYKCDENGENCDATSSSPITGQVIAANSITSMVTSGSCGDGAIQAGEECDCGADGICSEKPTTISPSGELNGKTCADIRTNPSEQIGALSCYPPESSFPCQLNAEKCGQIVTPENINFLYEGLTPADEATCGNGVVEPQYGEQCDCKEGDIWCTPEELNDKSCNSIKTEYPNTYHYFNYDNRPNGIYLWCYPKTVPENLRCKYNYQGCVYKKQPCFIDINCNGYANDANGEKCHPTGHYCYIPVRGCIDSNANNYNSKATDNDGSCTYSGQGVITTGTSNDQTGTGVGGISSVTFPLTYSNIPKTGDKTYSLIIKNPADGCKLLKGSYNATFTAYDNTNLEKKASDLFRIKIAEPLKLITERVNNQTPKIWIWLEKQETGKCTIKYVPYGYSNQQGPFNFDSSIDDGCGFRKALINIQDYKLKEGSNSVDIYCKFNDNTEKTITKTITVDLTKPEISIDLAGSQLINDIAYLTTGNTHINITSNEELSECKYTYSNTQLSNVQDSDLQYVVSTESYAVSGQSFIYDGTSINLANGRYYFYAKCKDKVSNPSDLKTLTANVNIPIPAPVTLAITLLEPNAGYSTTVPYHVKISTDKQAECRYMYSSAEIDYPAYNSLQKQFTTTNNLEHNTSNDIDGSVKYIYINCRDLETQTENKVRFKIGYDTTKPQITKLITDEPQNKIIEEVNGILKKKIFVGTDKEAICRYDKTINVFENMKGNFTDEGINDYTLEQNKEVQEGFAQGASVIFNIVCKARNGIVSELKQITIIVDLNAPLEITDTYPKGYIGKSEIKLRVSTNKIANCTFYKGATNYGNTTDKKDNHESNLITGLADGQQEFDVECVKGQEKRNGKITFTVDKSPPTTPTVKAESYCYGKEGESCKIIAIWSSEDLQSEIKRYWYYVANKTTSEVLFEAYTAEEKSEELGYNDLNLKSKFANGDEFVFLVSAENNANLLSQNGTDTAKIDYSVIRDDNIPPEVKVYFDKDGNLVLECKDNVNDKCKVLKYYLSSDGCPNEAEYENYDEAIKITSESVTKVCYIARDNSGNERKNSIKISDLRKKATDDSDGDGMKDDWENKYKCADKNKDDALADPDEDGLTNKEEYRHGTDPCEKDTDKDGITDKEEIDSGTDPLIPNESPGKVGDIDNDGMPDSWEEKYNCLDKNKADDNADPDKDGLSNKEEYGKGTSPCDPDSDDDGSIDGVEIEKGTNPLDKNDYPKSRWWLWTIIIVLALAGLSAASYFGYKEYIKMIKEKPKIIPKEIPRRAPILEKKKEESEFMKRRKEKEERRKELFEAFIPGRKEEKIEEIKPKKHEIDIFERLPKIVQKDVFKKLPGEEDVFKRLPKAGKEIFEKLPRLKRKEKKKRKKAQIAEQVIIYILAVLIFGLIVIFGYREISNLMQKQQQIDLINFENNLKDTISQLSSSYGDVKDFNDEPLKVPSGYNKLCFIELDKYESSELTSFPLIQNSWQDNVKVNVFLDDAKYSFYADNITIEPDNSKCFDITDGKLRIRLEGVGGSAKIS